LSRGKQANGDFPKANEHLNLLRNIRHADGISEDLWKRTIDLVETHAEAIVASASRIADRVKGFYLPVELSEAEICAFPEIQALTLPTKPT
jgi:hypothetical protein